MDSVYILVSCKTADSQILKKYCKCTIFEGNRKEVYLNINSNYICEMK